ncbi:MAG: hypothetical protein IPJ06_19950 [Saprospiraceae bacterium]|nr:hypothetical protein [Saprospiraceae bacterium]
MKQPYQAEIVERRKQTRKAHLQIGIIPTLAPYLVPLLFGRTTSRSAKVQLKIAEHTTNVLLDLLKRGQSWMWAYWSRT